MNWMVRADFPTPGNWRKEGWWVESGEGWDIPGGKKEKDDAPPPPTTTSLYSLKN
jgi:hypothetical protein